MVRQLSILFGFSLFCSGAFGAGQKPAVIRWEKDLTEASATVRKTKRPLLLLITAPGCVYCDRMKAEVFSRRPIIAQINDEFVALQLNGRKQTEVARSLRVRVYPTTVIVHPSGEVVKVLQGYRKPAEFAKSLVDAKLKLDVQDKLVAAQSKRTITR